MALYSYLQLTQRLLSDMRQVQFTDADLIAYINIARGQIAGEANCVRKEATLQLVTGTRSYPFSAIVPTDSTGVSGIFHVRMVAFQVASGQRYIRPRPWEWFDLYKLNNPVPPSGEPHVWAQYAQGALGSLYIDPLPDVGYVLNLDTTAIPIPLTDDTTAEAVPYPWTDAVPFFAAGYALASKPDDAAQKASAAFKTQYQDFMGRARRYANPSVNMAAWEQHQDLVMMNRLGVAPQGGG